MQVAKDCHLCDAYGTPLHDHDRQDYSTAPNGEAFLMTMQSIMPSITLSEMRAGDIVICYYERTPKHCAIVSDYREGGFGIIHAYAPAGVVVEHHLDVRWMRRIAAVFRAEKREFIS
jgi:uncharacterized protein YijF (DUF1287 family)